jgi:23S rRNA (pseudouridine1915-N3)-methyltransferase
VRLHCIAIDRVRAPHYRAAADDYLHRLRRYLPCQELELKPFQARSADAVRQHESAKLIAAVPDGAKLIALDERGRAFTSPTFARWVGDFIDTSQNLCFIIGGAHGLDDAARGRAHLLLQLSSMTLPHELARALLYEQLYRAMTILRGEPYHK